ncbi:unnamed protein product [Allacma fusca]|uniref:Uncharacterized protein n=1 Tax=Allacma fusca TaxID=39272 RepID=A0A8J2L092_9HEXA|nr:unnamed protein product [Allacma fusca]
METGHEYLSVPMPKEFRPEPNITREPVPSETETEWYCRERSSERVPDAASISSADIVANENVLWDYLGMVICLALPLATYLYLASLGENSSLGENVS